MAVTAVTVAAHAWWTWPDVPALARQAPAETAFMARDRAAGLAIRAAWVPYDSISPHLLRAVLVAEDIEFFSHGGFSLSEIWAALREAMTEWRRPRGASTITQQLAKNLWLRPDRTLERKVREALLAWHLERALGKRRILELYVNLIQYGPGVYGVEAAAQRYFGKPAVALTPTEGALLAAGLPRPSQWNPASPTPAYEARAEAIVARMGEATFLWRHLGFPDAPPPIRPAPDSLLPVDSASGTAAAPGSSLP